MTGIALGVHVHAQPERLRATLASIERNTAVDHDLVLLPDGPDGEIRQELAALGGLQQLPDEGVLGPAACLNRLVWNTDAGIVVILESGAVVGPRWLDHLVAALDSSPSAGLAGPSTNWAWNEQCAFPQAGSSLEEVARTAGEAERRFGALRRTLAPLYSLGDFCYAVRREVFAAIGEADESYSLGPCWEMDFNVRAARAGFDGLWAGAAYVWRAPLSSRRTLEEAARFESSKRRYQDKFCGARLRGEKTDYRMHCRGDACPNFAPREEAAAPALATPAVATPVAERTEPAGEPPVVPGIASSETPLVSCIMPTYDRRAFIPEALRCFFAQDYPNLELVVVDDGSDPIADLLPSDARIRYFRPASRMTVGAKRNYACEQARGAIIAHWDDDDWYPAWRVRAQVDALGDQGAAVCGSSILYFYDRARVGVVGRDDPGLPAGALAEPPVRRGPGRRGFAIPLAEPWSSNLRPQRSGALGRRGACRQRESERPARRLLVEREGRARPRGHGGRIGEGSSGIAAAGLLRDADVQPARVHPAGAGLFSPSDLRQSRARRGRRRRLRGRRPAPRRAGGALRPRRPAGQHRREAQPGLRRGPRRDRGALG
jgi:GT2 family glycosyltransferase